MHFSCKLSKGKANVLRLIATESIPIMSFVGFVPKPYKLNIGRLFRQTDVGANAKKIKQTVKFDTEVVYL